MFLLLLGFLGGGVLPVQSGVNARLKQAVGSPFLSSLCSFALGTLGLLLLVLAIQGSPALPTGMAAQPAWIWLGGAYGVVFLTLNILLIPRLGAVQTAIFPIVGQVLMGLLIDAGGWFHSPQVALTPLRALGGLVVVLGAVGVTLGGRSPAAAVRISPVLSPAQAWAWRIAGLAGGMLSAAQSATNGHLGRVLGSPFHAALCSFVVGTLALVTLNVVLRTHRRVPPRPGGSRGPWWVWFGGLLGATFVTVNAVLVPVLGAGTTVVVTLLGTLTASLVMDATGALGSARRPVGPRHLAGLALLIAGVVLVRLVG